MPIGFVLVSHSDKAAHAVAELAHEMANDVAIIPVGGDASGGLGSDPAAVVSACETLEETCERVILMADLGSARMSAEMAIEASGSAPDGTPRRVLGPGPFLEGTVAGTARAQTGAGLADVVRSIARSLDFWKDQIQNEGPAALADVYNSVTGFRTQVTVVDEQGLHARPAAILAEIASEEPVKVLINGVEADSMMDILLLGIGKGARVWVSSPDPRGEDAVKRVAAAIAAGLGNQR